MIQFCVQAISLFFFFNDTATTEISTLSLHDALPISSINVLGIRNAAIVNHAFTAGKLTPIAVFCAIGLFAIVPARLADRKSTRLNSSHQIISYAVFCLKKKKVNYDNTSRYMTEAANH